MRRDEAQEFAVPAVDVTKRGVTNANRLLQHGSKNRLKITRGPADDLEHIRCSRLLLQRFRKLSRPLAEVVSTLPQFVEQPSFSIAMTA